MSYRIVLNEVSYHGKDAIENLTYEVEKRNFKKALICSDEVLKDVGVVSKVTDILDQAGFAYSYYTDIQANPTKKNVKDGVSAFANSGADYIIAIGGGSVIDTAKAIGIIVNNPDFSDVASLEGFASTKKKSVAILAFPTTAGTAAEVTINYVITDEDKDKKMVCVDEKSIPVCAFVDPSLMSSMPKSLIAATGMDALTHAIEGYITMGANEFSDMFHLTAIKVISRNLVDAVHGDEKALENMAMAQYVAGMGFSNVGLGAVHAMAHPLGALYNTPHGVANAILLPVVMKYNASSTGDKFKDIAKAMGSVKKNLTQKEWQEEAVNLVIKLSQDVEIPADLSDIVLEKDLDFLAQSAIEDACFPSNPCVIPKEDIIILYQSLM